MSLSQLVEREKKQCKHIGVKFLGIWILVTCSEIFPNIGYFLLLSQLCASLAPIILYHNCYGCPDILLLLCCIYYFEVLRDYCISLRWTFSLIFFLFAKIQCCHQAIRPSFITCTWTSSVKFSQNLNL